MLRGNVAVMTFAVCLCLHAPDTLGQVRPHGVNPEAIEFAEPVSISASAAGYLCELFAASADTRRDPPITSANIDVRSRTADGRIRVEVNRVAADVPNGTYVMTIRPLEGGTSTRSDPSDPFVVLKAGTGTETELDRDERFWTKVAIAIGAGVILIPILLR
jgi:hypothetical protein